MTGPADQLFDLRAACGTFRKAIREDSAELSNLADKYRWDLDVPAMLARLDQEIDEAIYTTEKDLEKRAACERRSNGTDDPSMKRWHEGRVL